MDLYLPASPPGNPWICKVGSMQRILHICLRMGNARQLEWAWQIVHQAHSRTEIKLKWYYLALVVVD